MASLLTSSEKDFQSAADWSLTNCTMTPGISTTGGNPYGVTGPQAKLTSLSAANIKATLARFAPATPLVTHRCGAWVWTADTLSSVAGVDWYDSSFTLLSTSSATTAGVASTWIPFAAGTPTAPSGAVWAKPWFQINSVPNAHDLWIALGVYAIVDPPWRLHNKPSTLWQSRRARSSLLQIPGTRGWDEMRVVHRGAGPNLSVDVTAGAAYVQGNNIAAQGMYYVENDAPKNIVLADADTVNPRITSVFAKVIDSKFSSEPGPPTPDNWGLVAVDGTPASSPAAPATPLSSLRLADITVPTNARAILDSNIADKRTFFTTQGAQIFTLDGSNILLQAGVGPWVQTNFQGWAQGWAFIPYKAPFPNRTISVAVTDTGPWGSDGKIRIIVLRSQRRDGFWVAVRYDTQPYRGLLLLQWEAIGA